MLQTGMLERNIKDNHDALDCFGLVCMKNGFMHIKEPWWLFDEEKPRRGGSQVGLVTHVNPVG